MEKSYLKKIIANSAIDLKYISACCYQAKVSDIKFLRNNKIFLIYLERYNIESNEKKIKIISVIKCEYVSVVKSKNIIALSRHMHINNNKLIDTKSQKKINSSKHLNHTVLQIRETP